MFNFLKRPAVSLSAFYFAALMAVGIIFSFLPLYCERIGFTSLQIAAVSAMLGFAEALFSIPWSIAADKSKNPHSIFRLGVFLCTAVVLFLPFFDSFVPFAALFFVFSIFQISIFPQLDAVSVKEERTGKISYGTVRSIGSSGYLCIVLVGGVLIKFFGIRVVPALLVFSVLLEFATFRFLPKLSHHEGHVVPSLSHVKELILLPGILAFLVACFLAQASQGLYYGFFSIWLDANGYGPVAIGGMWSLAMLAEIVALWKGRVLFRRFSVKSLFLTALVFYSIRWGILGLGASAPLVITSQLLNAISFGVFHLSAIKYIYENSPLNLKQTGLAIYNTTAFGVGSSVGILAAGNLVDNFKMSSLFFASSAVAMVGFLVFLAQSMRQRHQIKEPLKNYRSW